MRVGRKIEGFYRNRVCALVPTCQFVDSSLRRKNPRIARVNIGNGFSNYRVSLKGISLILGTCLYFVYYSLGVIA